MERTQDFIANWNGFFPNYPLTTEDLKKPHSVMGALFQVFDRLGIDRDAVLAPPPEENRTENTIYYWDLLPVINMTRVTNHLFSLMPQLNDKFKIVNFLQPTTPISYMILVLLFNLMVFNEDRLRDIAPHEEELFAKRDQVKTLEVKKNKLIETLNKQAEEKGKRAERLEKLDNEIKQLEDELKQEKEAHDVEKQELEALLKENRQTDMLLEQKKSHRDAVMAEVAKKRALRVYDAEDIKAQAEQAAQNVQEAQEKLNSLRSTLMQKENNLKNLQNIKPNLDTANNLLHDIMKLSDSLKDFESGDLDSDSKEGELAVLDTELSELQVQLSELQAARAEASEKRVESQARRHQERTVTQNAVREAEETDKKLREKSEAALRRTEDIRQDTQRYAARRQRGADELAAIDDNFKKLLNRIDEILLGKAEEATNKIQAILRQRKK